MVVDEVRARDADGHSLEELEMLDSQADDFQICSRGAGGGGVDINGDQEAIVAPESAAGLGVKDCCLDPETIAGGHEAVGGSEGADAGDVDWLFVGRRGFFGVDGEGELVDFVAELLREQEEGAVLLGVDLAWDERHGCGGCRGELFSLLFWCRFAKKMRRWACWRSERCVSEGLMICGIGKIYF